MFGYKLEETRLRQIRTSVSAANANSVDLPAVPEGKIWIIHASIYYPSAAETQSVCAKKYVPAFGAGLSILNPSSLALSSGLPATFIEQGMEYFLMPGEYITWTRGDHTAGSTMISGIQFTEIDLPLYTYEDPQTVKRQERALSTIRTQLGGGIGGVGSRGPIEGISGPGRRGGPLEK